MNKGNSLISQNFSRSHVQQFTKINVILPLYIHIRSHKTGFGTTFVPQNGTHKKINSTVLRLHRASYITSVKKNRTGLISYRKIC